MVSPIVKQATSDADTSRIKVPPHSIEAEQAVIGGLMLDNSKWDAVSEVITSADFYRQDHRLIFAAIERLAGDGEPLDVVTLSEFLERGGDIDDAGGINYLAEMAEKTPGASNIGAYANIVRERSVIRQLIEVSGGIADSAFNPKGRTSDDLLDEAERNVFKIAESRAKEGTGPQSINPILTKALSRIETLFESGDAITGTTTGFKDLDEWTSGMQPSDLVIVAGRPSMGKTTFAMNLVENALMGSGEPVLVFSMEMPADSIVMRMLSSLGRIDQTRMRSGRLEEEDWPRLTSAVSLLKDKPLYIDDTAGLSPTEMRSRARRIARENNGKIGLIMVDYLQLMRVPGSTEGRTAEISEISRSLKGLAKELSCPVVALSQLNRSLEQRPNKRPVNSDLRESGAIEQDADVIMFIYRDEVYNEDSADKGIAEIIIGKQRNGPIGTVRLAFIGKYTKFEDLAHGDYGGDY
ncbi:MAG: replicative DNA helicase [Alteromonadaceae bacterium]|uniref:replicative DNA helicase n=1 Tax=unclassified Marinobacter TaxID=83889 RepID=UPI000C4871DF|nr:replicative DNA helicase [Marinobacter sp. BGYM27]MAA64673.1 replicative DNA helicase [Alteromonadaceae bacterium]MBH84623.1 replicative DNA helicase [Alteromonadaceae bacterium]MDG5498177.1 replicative DNA helicase [Marinobacter sp. BGYM27]|tara:strand:- start:17196 stop:18593 length:1398 start_codon:yes stop_codon:yes gene_type:complete